ncbi:MAG: serine/threonine protein kinase [bacterium]|nr:serine/threonine protein kinase [bacterium]
MRERVGRGAMADVYSGELEDGARVAVKVARLEGARSSIRERFCREAQLVCRLSHPNIVCGIGCGTMPGCSGAPFVVLEYLCGGSLLDLMREQLTIEPARALGIAEQIARALAYLHLDGRIVAHRDIKPANILFDADGVPKLSDLGVAKTRMVVSEDFATKIAGTLRYMSPEQLADCSKVDIRSDIYSLGVVLYEMITGASPWKLEGKNPIRLSSELPSLSESATVRTALAPFELDALDALIQRACAPEPFERFQTPAAFARAASDLVRDLAEGRSGNSRSAIRHRRRRPRVAAIAATVSTALLAAALLANSSQAVAERSPNPMETPPVGREIQLSDSSP